MPTIAIVATDLNGRPSHPRCARRAVAAAGGQVRIVTAAAGPDALDGVGGLFVPDSGDDDAAPPGANLLAAALAADLPTLLTGDGMHLLNAAFGGQPPTSVNDHHHDGRHQIYLSPGSKVAAIIGSAGMFRVNSRHRRGLREPQRAPRLLSIAYRLDDGVIEGLESKEHGWVIGLQFAPERSGGAPAGYNNLFLGLVERAGDFMQQNRIAE